ncbi:MAG TPA: DUF1501 domain-containing protein [Gemmataceae bacterium]|jgi:uncharacterized protein (DUF1501 family)|nr:DUF1501 domain-containing protein [Gemmataceae bacterium]
MITRRDFLKTSSMIALGSSIPSFLSKTAAQAPLADRPGARDTILVVVQLTGGNDGLNTVIPYADPAYARLRPTLRQSRDQVRRINDQIGLHPSMNAMADLLQDQSLCIVQGVGYPNPSQSHFRSMDIWQAAGTQRDLTEGWIGKALRHIPAASSFHLAGNNESAPLALTGSPVRVPSITSLADFQLRLEASGSADRREQQQVIEATAAPAAAQSSGGLLDFVQQTAVNTYASSQRLRDLSSTYVPRVPYPNSALANHLRLAAQLIDAGLGARLFYVTLDGFDTHAGQAGPHANLLRDVSDAISAFYRDLSQRGHRDRLMIMTFSEFGRRAQENGSRGTDHGSGAPMFLVGGRVKPGLIGAHPSLTNLEDGNLRHHTDFRQVYAAVLDSWLGIPSRQVLGQEFKPVDVLRS